MQRSWGDLCYTRGCPNGRRWKHTRPSPPTSVSSANLCYYQSVLLHTLRREKERSSCGNLLWAPRVFVSKPFFDVVLVMVLVAISVLVAIPFPSSFPIPIHVQIPILHVSVRKTIPFWAKPVAKITKLHEKIQDYDLPLPISINFSPILQSVGICHLYTLALLPWPLQGYGDAASGCPPGGGRITGA